ncbi:MAG: alpha/beta hydrolase [Planctomycetota bacterium]|jgi:acetyl esterase/lipase
MQHLQNGLLAALLLLPALLTAQSARYRDQVFSQVDVQTDIVYGAATNAYTKQTEVLKLDRYTPRNDTVNARPAVVVVHGGGVRSGDKATGNFRRLCDDFARRGYLAVSINYRLRPGNLPINLPVDVRQAKEDCKAAVRFLRKNAVAWGVDTGRIGCIGSSAGGYAVLAGAYVPGEGSSGNPNHSSAVHAVVNLWGGLLDVNDLQQGEPPVCSIHGSNDKTVPVKLSQDIHQQARKVGVASELHVLQGAGHAPWSTFFQGYMDDVVAFYWEQLALGKVAGLGARPGFASPGSLTLDAFGVAGDMRVLYLALGTKTLDLGPVGVVCLDPAVMFVLPLASFGSSSRLPAATTTFQVPAGHGGTTVYWQELHLRSAAAARLVTNCLVTRF